MDGESRAAPGPSPTTMRPSADALQLALLETLLASAPLGIGLWDRDLRCVRVNERLAEMHGVPVGQHVGRTVGGVLGELGTSVEAALREVLETGVPVHARELTGATSVQAARERHWRAARGARPPRGADGRGG